MRALWISLLLLALASGMAIAQQKTAPPQAKRQKLVMKDGTDQWVRGYQRTGDRVRFYSIERDDWEEVPASLVDWKATDDANRRQQAEGEKLAEEAKAADDAAKTEMMGPEVAPGIRLPDNADGIYIINNDGKLVPLPKQEAAAHVDKGRIAQQILVPVPGILKNKNLVEIPGARAEVRLENSPAALFATGKVRDDSRYGLARLKQKGNNRQVEAILTNVLGRNPTHSGDYVELETQTVAPDIYRLVPRQSLPPGEYAVVEFLGKDINLYLWDFAVGK